MAVHPKLREVLSSTVNELEQSPDVTPEDAGKLKQVVLQFATELEVAKTEPLPPTTATDD